MLSFKIISEYCVLNCTKVGSLTDLLPTSSPSLRRVSHVSGNMADKLHVAIRSMSLEDDDPIILPDEPKFHLFDENALSIIGQDRAMAMQYISHSNETERRARILRVQQSIELEKSNPPAVLTKISHNLEKEKGHVFGYGVSESASGETRMVAHALTAPAGERIHSSSEVQLSGESISPASAPKRPAVFTIGASGSSQTGSSRGRRNGRNRPPAWVRHIRPAKNAQSKSTPVHEQSDEVAPSSKRKAEGVQIEKGNKTSKTKEDTVASILRPLPSQ
ncbi:unnamed protein product [Brassica rapa]|uniref:Uncharacterized protein n=1 Tax=Brassica campestris TaxID=3711 RepID=A0A3P5YG94_BRACM|nr:unnamed protein product [Brassica rapa]VDC61825.1 unnamed protein product [Brassica rapa]